MLLLVSFLLPLWAHAAAGDFMGELLAPPGAAQSSRARFEHRHYGNVIAARENFSQSQSKVELSAPFAKSETSSWRASASAEYDAYKTKAPFTNGRPFPNRLWDTGLSISHSRTVEGNRTVGGSFGLSSASDRPFGAGRDLGYSLNLSYKVPGENESAWIFFLSSSNTRGFLNYIPLPGLAYMFKAHERLRLVLGLPFVMAFWNPSDLWNVSFVFFPVRTAELRVSYGPRFFQGYALVSSRSRNFRLAGRSDKEERLFSEEGLVQAGLVFPIGQGLQGDLGGGVAFARRNYLASKSSDRNSAPSLRPANAGFAQLKINASF